MSAELALARHISRCPLDDAEACQYPFSLLLRFGTLPHAALFVDALWSSSTRLRACVEDAKDFFYLLAMPEVRHVESAFGLPVKAGEFSDLLDGTFSSQEEMIPVLTSVAMGDQKAMFIAQSAHQHSLWHSGALRAESWLTWGYSTPTIGLWQGAYCDDYAQLAFVDPCLSGTRTNMQSVLGEAEQARSAVYASYDETGFVRKPEKSVLDEEEPEIWGARLSSSTQTVGGKPSKMLELASTTLQIIRHGASTSSQMQCVIGTWVHFLMFRRPMMCILDHTYAWTQAPPVRPRVLRKLSGEVVDELMALVLLLPWMNTHLASSVSCYCFLSDATLVRGAVVRSRLSLSASVALWRLIPRQSGAIRWRDPVDEESDTTSIRCPMLISLASCMECSLVSSFRFSHSAHVNVQEAVALRTAVKAACRDEELWGTRTCFLVDSMVVQSTWCRGRSSSHQLNRVQQMTLPYILSIGLVPFFGWLPTESNPADDPTRDVALRRAAEIDSDLEEYLQSTCEREPWPWDVTALNWHRKGWECGSRTAVNVHTGVESRSEMQFDSTKGFPGEGPVRDAAVSSHAEVDLSITVQPGTLRRYTACWQRLQSWMSTEGLGAIEQLLDHDHALNSVLRAFIQHLHNQASPVSWGSETLAALQCFAPHTRGRLGPSWLMQRQFG
eukprot:3082248-Amphidinium_carterae.2